MSKEQAVSLITAAYMAEVEYRQGSFLPDEHTTAHIAKVADWLTQPKPKFGMLLCGQCGNGKSTLVRAVRGVLQYLYYGVYGESCCYLRIVDAKEIVNMAKHDLPGYKSVCNEKLLAIDDLGIEPSEVLDYGNVLNPAVDLLTTRYNDQLFTMITTNLTPPQIREHYGDRIADRFNEMMERIVFNNDTYRK